MLAPTDWRKVQALQDFQQALSALTFFAEIPEQATRVQRRRFRCYHDLAVVAYCRPFTTSGGLPKLSLKSLGVRPTASERTLHERLMDYRNKVVAHTDADRMRLLVTSFEVSEGILMPYIVEDEGFEFLRDVEPLDRWLRRVHAALAKCIFEKVQAIPSGTRFIKDFLLEQ